MLGKLILALGVGYVWGNPKAQRFVNDMATKSIQLGIDTLNKKPISDVIAPKVEMPIEKAQK